MLFHFTNIAFLHIHVLDILVTAFLDPRHEVLSFYFQHLDYPGLSVLLLSIMMP